ncbi:hypothetical protein B0H16DRAFT_1562120 [Mycena metata]|uniref:NADAR domain-containing protein n=1 Tax=Mycena metata TaxID=1033252 RepID=A0AAD7N292_9AGAR|nr:hypothetical protein B0H16DRAFT_1562120 [Mycena metata]
MGSSSSKPQVRPYPLVTPGYNVPYGQDPNLFLPPQLQTHTQKTSSHKKKRKSKRDGSVSELAQAYVQGWHAGKTGMGPQLPLQPAVAPPPQDNTRPVIPPAPVAPSINTHRAQTPFAGGGAFTGPPQQQQQEPQQPQSMQPQVQPPSQQPAQGRASADIARVLQPLPPPNPSVFGPPPSQQPRSPLANPLPAPPRDLYELSPYNTLLNLPQTTALLTAAYTQQGGLPPSYGRRRGTRTGGLLRALTGRGRKEEDVHFVPVFINGQRQPATSSSQQPPAGGLGVPGPAPRPADPTPVILQDPPFPVPRQNLSDGSFMSPAPIRFNGSTPPYNAFLNYSPHRIVYNDIEYPSAMHLHEAMRFLPNDPTLAQRIRSCPDGAQVHPLSEQLARDYPASTRSDWPTAYLSCMEEAILHKFRQHPDLREMLLRTGDAPLIYADEHDSYWGEGMPGENGMNHLGHLLERVRMEIRREGGLA